jgi:hypothetical protein
VAAALTALLAYGSPAKADDCYITEGGLPAQQTGHKTISMASEFVDIVVGKNWVTVDCTFRFKNAGPACVVRMGFPDEVNRSEEDEIRRMPEGSFRSFRSWVDGKPVATKVIRASGDEDASDTLFWHEKRVQFPAHGEVVVRDRYVTNVCTYDGLAFWTNGTGYILHTGASWHGRIGKAVIKFTFRRKRMRGPFTLAHTNADGDDLGAAEDRAWMRHRRRIYYTGRTRPSTQGDTLTFKRANFRPSSDDDIMVFFDPTPFRSRRR